MKINSIVPKVYAWVDANTRNVTQVIYTAMDWSDDSRRDVHALMSVDECKKIIADMQAQQDKLLESLKSATRFDMTSDGSWVKHDDVAEAIEEFESHGRAQIFV